MSESEFTIDHHFDGRSPTLRPLYDQVMDIVQNFGPVAAEPKKTCIHLARRTALAGIHFRKDCLLLEFKTAGPIDDPAIAKSEQLSAKRWHHTVRLDSPSVLTEDVRAWLKEAYDLSE